MRIDWDVPVTMDDGLVLRADLYRPPQEGKYPVILSYGPYAKGLASQDGYPDQFLSSANWGGQELHPRGNFEGITQPTSKQKWLEVHGLEHWTEFYTRYGVTLQKRFFDHLLKGLENDLKNQPRVQLQIRRLDGF